ncbi:MAG: radical SAM protein [Alphaproteobacteria bacterium]
MQSPTPLRPFTDPQTTAKGEPRARIGWTGLKTLWLNTGTLCNIACRNCYIDSSPTNDRLVYLSLADVTPFLDEIDAAGTGPVEIGITGGEPFMAPDSLAIMDACLAHGHRLLVLTNAMRPMMRPRIQAGLRDLAARFPHALRLRVSLDHHERDRHDAERGAGSFALAMEGLAWLAAAGIPTAIAGRHALAEESETQARAAYGRLARSVGLALDETDPSQLVLFPEMREDGAPPEITDACWGLLGVDPASIMCASQRMVIRRKGSERASVTACTLIVDDPAFELGTTLAEATRDPVPLNHPWCASFCVLGGGSCSA